ncbi:MAG: hypothetical protein KY455_03605, partial [Euryarchaeota archaeon]|nr:hypothetical protein [Euryarchaeota archaeon]
CPQPDAGLISRAMMDMLPSQDDLIPDCDQNSPNNESICKPVPKGPIPGCDWPIPEFLCDPDPQLRAEYDPFVCTEACSTSDFIILQPGADGTEDAPGTWLVACQHNLIITTVTLFLIATEKACPSGTDSPTWTPMPLTPADAVDKVNGPILRITTGECTLSGVGTVYGWGVGPFATGLPCAQIQVV